MWKMYELLFAISFFCKDRNSSDKINSTASNQNPMNVFDLAVNNLYSTRNDALLESPNSKKHFDFEFQQSQAVEVNPLLTKSVI